MARNALKNDRNRSSSTGISCGNTVFYGKDFWDFFSSGRDWRRAAEESLNFNILLLKIRGNMTF
jgi:hypothetical protein